MATESPDLRVSLDLLDIAIAVAAERLTPNELMEALKVVGRDSYLTMHAAGSQHELAEFGSEELRQAVEDVLYDNRCHASHHPYFVEAVVRRLISKRDGGAVGFAREYPVLYRKLQDEHLDVLADGKLVAAGWKPPESMVRFRPTWIEKIDDEDVVTGLELLEDLQAGFKSGRAAVEVPIARESVRLEKFWDKDLAQRRGVYVHSRERIAGLLVEKGELKGLERLPEQYPEKERYRISADPRRVDVLIEIFLHEYERRPSVRMAQTRSVPGWPGERQRKRPHERKAEAVQGPQSVGEPERPAPDFSWVNSCEEQIALEALDILRGVKTQHDLEKDVIRISPYPRGTDALLWPGYHEAKSRARMDVAQMLVKKGIVTKAEFEYKRSYEPAGLPKALVIEGDWPAMERCLEMLRERLERKSSWTASPSLALAPASKVAPGPAPALPSRKPNVLVRLWERVKEKFVDKFAEHSATVLWWIIILALLGLAGGYRRQILVIYHQVRHAVSDPDTTARR